MKLDWKTNYWEPDGFRIGDVVKILPPDEKARAGLKGGWEDNWNSKMDDTVGLIGKVERITLKNKERIEQKFTLIPLDMILKIRVRFNVEDWSEDDEDDSRDYWAYPPWMLRKV